MLTCASCGATAEEGPATLTWSTAVERGRLQHHCTVCSRTHLRAMEGKLDSEYW